MPVFQRVREGRASVVASVLSEAEAYVRPLRDRDRRALQRVTDLFSEDGIEVVQASRAIGRRAALLRADYRPLKLPDAMIIATALDAGCDLIVGNDEEWKKLKGIPYVHLDDIIDE
jgi:predicted nucleic acid-binding protein